MMKDKAATLTSALMVAKGAAVPAGLLASGPGPAMRRAPYVNGTGPRRAARPAPTRPRRIKLTVRLDPAQHLRLKLTAAHLQRSIQDLLAEALERQLSLTAPKVRDGSCLCVAQGTAPARQRPLTSTGT